MTAQWELKKGWYCKQQPQQTSNNKPPWVGRFEVEVKLSLIRAYSAGPRDFQKRPPMAMVLMTMLILE
jgi:hypothetical protein